MVEYEVKKLTGPRYVMHCFCRTLLGCFSRFTSLPSPMSNLYFQKGGNKV